MFTPTHTLPWMNAHVHKQLSISPLSSPGNHKPFTVTHKVLGRPELQLKSHTGVHHYQKLMFTNTQLLMLDFWIITLKCSNYKCSFRNRLIQKAHRIHAKLNEETSKFGRKKPWKWECRDCINRPGLFTLCTQWSSCALTHARYEPL